MKHRKKSTRKLLRPLGTLHLFKADNRFIVSLRNETEFSFNSLKKAERFMLLTFYKIVESNNQRFIN